MSETDRSRIKAILASVLTILGYARGVSAKAFLSDPVLQDAILMRLVVVGEAAARLSDEVVEATKSIPWRQIIGMRNVIAHAYGSINLEVVWNTVTQQLPDLRNRLRDLMGETP